MSALVARLDLPGGKFAVGVAAYRYPDVAAAGAALDGFKPLLVAETQDLSTLRFADPPLTSGSPAYIALITLLVEDADDALLPRLGSELERLGGYPCELEKEVVVALALRHIRSSVSGRPNSHLRFGTKGGEMDGLGNYILTRNQG